MSSASSTAISGNITYGNADASGTWTNLIIAGVVVAVAVVVLMLFGKTK